MVLGRTRRSFFDQLPIVAAAAALEPFDHTPEGLAGYRMSMERSDTPMSLSSVDLDDFGTVLECNTALVLLLAAPREELVGAHWHDFTPEEDRLGTDEAVRALIEGEREISRVETCFRRPSGSEVWVSASVGPVLDAAGRTVALLTQMVDITARWHYRLAAEASAAHRERVAELERSIARDEYVLLYEPVFDLETGRAVALDAVGPCLADRPAVPTRRLIEMADDLDRGVELGMWILERACRDRAAWAPPDSEADAPHVIVPLPGPLLATRDLAERVHRAANAAHVTLRQLAVQLDERDLLDATRHAEAQVAELSGDGLRVYVGDFGRGIAPAERLWSVPVDGLKGAGSFVARLPNEADQRVLGALVAIGRAVDLPMVAEGIAGPDQLHVLQDLGCPLGKGPFLSEHVTVEEVPTALQHPPALLSTAGRPVELLAEPTSDLGPTLTVGAAAHALRTSPSTLRRWADDGRIRSIRTAGGHRRFPLAEVRRVSGRANLRVRPQLRLQPAIDTPRPRLAALLAEHGRRLARLAPANMYTGAAGWFAEPEAESALDLWADRVMQAARDGDQTVLTTACGQLSDLAGGGGALLLEVLTFVAVFFASVEYAIGRDGLGPDTSADARQLAGAARQAVLLHVDGHD